MPTSRSRFFHRIRAAPLALAFVLAAPLPVMAVCPGTTAATQATAIASGHAFAKQSAFAAATFVVDTAM